MEEYEDIINLPHHVSKRHMPMAVSDRAAQFASFAALRGHSDAIDETGRCVDSFVDLDEYEKEILNSKLEQLIYGDKKNTKITINYFVPDMKKAGGTYVTTTGFVKKIDEYNRLIIMIDDTVIPIDYIADIVWID